MAGFIGEQHSKKNRPLAVPVPRDLVVDVLHRRRQFSHHRADGGIDLRLRRDCYWDVHCS